MKVYFNSVVVLVVVIFMSTTVVHAAPTERALINLALSGWVAARMGVAPALAMAVVWQESRGKDNARSKVGARGLFQVMPTTGREIGVYESALLDHAPIAAVAGIGYLRDRLKQYDQDQHLALAAYNAGPGRVNQWLKRFGDPRRGIINHARWTAKIPFAETRNYVRQVLKLTAAIQQCPPAQLLKICLQKTLLK